MGVGGFKGFPHTITYSTMHFKMIWSRKKKNRCGDLLKNYHSSLYKMVFNSNLEISYG